MFEFSQATMCKALIDLRSNTKCHCDTSRHGTITGFELYRFCLDLARMFQEAEDVGGTAARHGIWTQENAGRHKKNPKI